MYRHQGAIFWEFIDNKSLEVQQTFVVDKFPEDGALVSKHVAVGTWYEVCVCNLFYCILISAFCWFYKYGT